jgi:hypothetical protein
MNRTEILMSRRMIVKKKVKKRMKGMRIKKWKI